MVNVRSLEQYRCAAEADGGSTTRKSPCRESLHFGNLRVAFTFVRSHPMTLLRPAGAAHFVWQLSWSLLTMSMPRAASRSALSQPPGREEQAGVSRRREARSAAEPAGLRRRSGGGVVSRNVSHDPTPRHSRHPFRRRRRRATVTMVATRFLH